MGDVMAELFEAVASWPTLLLVLLVFGFAPGFVLRTIVLCYPKGDPRRAELVAELYVLSHLMRPLWVAQQCETALFEGLSARSAARRAGRDRAKAAEVHRSRLRHVTIWVGTLAVLGLLGFTGYRMLAANPVDLWVVGVAAGFVGGGLAAVVAVGAFVRRSRRRRARRELR